MTYRKIIALLMVVFDRGYTQSCSQNGELLPNPDDCRKYFKCAQGSPTDQACPGTLIFDPVLKICNWPTSSQCIKDLLPKQSIRTKPVIEKEPEKEFTKVTRVRNGGEDDILELTAEGAPSVQEEKLRAVAIQTLFDTSDRQSSAILIRRRPKPTTAPTRSTTRRSFAQRGSHLNSLRESLLRNRQRQEESLQTRDRTHDREKPGINARVPFTNINQSLRDRLRDRIRTSNNDENVVQDVESDDIRDKFKQDTLRDAFSDLQQDEILEAPTAAPRPKFKAKPFKCGTGASNELYAHPRNCRKYFKCEATGPSLQSCPANLIFDTQLRICNWPDATSCQEDPDAPLPEITSDDRAPPRNPNGLPVPVPTVRSVIKEIEQPVFDPKPSPSHGNQPSYREALERELQITSEYPLFEAVKKTVRTLDTDIVEKIEPGSPENPDNVQRVEFILSEENFNDLFPRRHASYTYKRLLQAIAKFPAVCSYVGREEASDKICRKTLATMFAHFAQETGNHNPSDPDYDEWRQGLAAVRESGCTDTSPGCGYNSNCEDTDQITKKWSCGVDNKGKFNKFYGRGAKQLSYNFNYGQFSQAMFGDGRLLLDFPDFVATTWLNLASATWFYATPQPPKPSMLHVIDGTWVPNSVDRANGIEPGFGATINIINGGLECNTKDGRETKQALNRIEYYKQFAWYLYVDYSNETLGCAKQKQFSAGGSGALPIYWDKDWSVPFSCKLVSYQTAFSALVPAEYLDCVEENFNIKIR